MNTATINHHEHQRVVNTGFDPLSVDRDATSSSTAAPYTDDEYQQVMEYLAERGIVVFTNGEWVFVDNFSDSNAGDPLAQADLDDLFDLVGDDYVLRSLGIYSDDELARLQTLGLVEKNQYGEWVTTDKRLIQHNDQWLVIDADWRSSEEELADLMVTLIDELRREKGGNFDPTSDDIRQLVIRISPYFYVESEGIDDIDTDDPQALLWALLTGELTIAELSGVHLYAFYNAGYITLSQYSILNENLDVLKAGWAWFGQYYDYRMVKLDEAKTQLEVLQAEMKGMKDFDTMISDILRNGDKYSYDPTSRINAAIDDYLKTNGPFDVKIRLIHKDQGVFSSSLKDELHETRSISSIEDLLDLTSVQKNNPNSWKDRGEYKALYPDVDDLNTLFQGIGESLGVTFSTVTKPHTGWKEITGYGDIVNSLIDEGAVSLAMPSELPANLNTDDYWDLAASDNWAALEEFINEQLADGVALADIFADAKFDVSKYLTTSIKTNVDGSETTVINVYMEKLSEADLEGLSDTLQTATANLEATIQSQQTDMQYAYSRSTEAIEFKNNWLKSILDILMALSRNIKQ